MTYLFDTDLISFFGKKTVPAKLDNWVQENEGDIFLSVVSLAELEFGVSTAPLDDRERLAEWVSKIKAEFAPATLGLETATLVRWKALLADLKRKQRTMSCEDSLIAATALHHTLTVATRNERHFEPSGVRIFNPLSG